MCIIEFRRRKICLLELFAQSLFMLDRKLFFHMCEGSWHRTSLPSRLVFDRCYCASEGGAVLVPRRKPSSCMKATPIHATGDRCKRRGSSALPFPTACATVLNASAPSWLDAVTVPYSPCAVAPSSYPHARESAKGDRGSMEVEPQSLWTTITQTHLPSLLKSQLPRTMPRSHGARHR